MASKEIIRLWPNGTTERLPFSEALGEKNVLDAVQKAPLSNDYLPGIEEDVKVEACLWAHTAEDGAEKNPYASFLIGRLVFGPAVIAGAISNSQKPKGLDSAEIANVLDLLGRNFCEKQHENVCLRIWRGAEAEDIGPTINLRGKDDDDGR